MMIRPSTVEPLSSLGTGYYDAGLSNNKRIIGMYFFSRENPLSRPFFEVYIED